MLMMVTAGIGELYAPRIRAVRVWGTFDWRGSGGDGSVWSGSGSGMGERKRKGGKRRTYFHVEFRVVVSVMCGMTRDRAA